MREEGLKHPTPTPSFETIRALSQAWPVSCQPGGLRRSGVPSRLAGSGGRGGVCGGSLFALGSRLKTPTRTGLPAQPPLGPPSPTQAQVLAAPDKCGRQKLSIQQMRGTPGSLCHPLNTLHGTPGPTLDPDLGEPRLFAARGPGRLGREGCEHGAAAYLGSAVLRRECRGLFVPGLTAQNWGSPCKRLPSQTPPRTRPQPPSLRSPEHSRRSLCKLLQRP